MCIARDNGGVFVACFSTLMRELCDAVLGLAPFIPHGWKVFSLCYVEQLFIYFHLFFFFFGGGGMGF
jgi:hypothetical protein